MKPELAPMACLCLFLSESPTFVLGNIWNTQNTIICWWNDVFNRWHTYSPDFDLVFPGFSSFQIASQVVQKHNFLQLIINLEKLACRDKWLKRHGANSNFSKTCFWEELHFQPKAKEQQEYGCKETKELFMWTWSFPASPETSETDPQVNGLQRLFSFFCWGRLTMMHSFLWKSLLKIFTHQTQIFFL